MTQSANTTVSFANTEGNTDVVYLIREKDATDTARTITWPSGMVWNGGTEPTLNTTNFTNEAQVFKLTTRDNGATWYGVEQYNNKGGNELWVTGFNGGDWRGVLGQNNTITYSSPIQISGATWTGGKIKIGLQGGDIKTDGTLWTWGANTYGRLGLNNEVQYSSPTQIPGTTWAMAHFSGISGASMCAVKTDGTMWMWGWNQGGQLGQNNETQYSSPVQIPGSTRYLNW